MRRIVGWLGVIVLATALPIPAVVASAPSDADGTGEVIADAGQSARTDGEYVVWINGHPDVFDPTTQLWVRRVDGGDPYPVTSTANARGWPAIDGGVVVWIENHPEPGCPLCRASLFGRDLASGREFVITDDVLLSALDKPSISGNLVVWARSNTIWVRDIAAMSEQLLVATLDETSCYDRYGPVISGDRVVWMECYEPEVRDPLGYPNFRILTKRLGEDAATVVADEPANPVGFDLAGDRLVYISPKSGVVVVDLASGARQVVGEGRNPTIGGRLVLWEAPADPWDAGNPRVDLEAFDLPTATRFAAVAGQQVNLRPDIVGGVVVWQRDDEDMSGPEQPAQVRAAHTSELWPTAPRPQPPIDPNVTWYPATGHGVGWGFRAFWEANGGLAVFGFPLTGEVAELDSAEGAWRTTQYFERQRFEWHPENTGTPYEVLLGRLGAELLIAQGRDWRDLPTADAGAPHYQPETGHAIDRRFWPLWSSRGLDLGDSGVSFRESLALFGFPLSEPMLETNGDSDEVLTQYFERAVFEWHPANPVEWQVLLRRLGAEAVTRRGW